MCSVALIHETLANGTLRGGAEDREWNYYHCYSWLDQVQVSDYCHSDSNEWRLGYSSSSIFSVSMCHQRTTRLMLIKRTFIIFHNPRQHPGFQVPPRNSESYGGPPEKGD